MKKIVLCEELHNRYWPKIMQLLETGNDPNKINCNLDICGENLRELEQISSQVQNYIRDFKTCKKLILDKTFAKEEQTQKDLEK